MENVGQVRRIQVAKHGVFSTGRVLGGLVTGGLVLDGLVLVGLIFVSFRDLVNCGCVVLLRPRAHPGRAHPAAFRVVASVDVSGFCAHHRLLVDHLHICSALVVVVRLKWTRRTVVPSPFAGCQIRRCCRMACPCVAGDTTVQSLKRIREPISEKSVQSL